jgi:hypothetical protein
VAQGYWVRVACENEESEEMLVCRVEGKRREGRQFIGPIRNEDLHLGSRCRVIEITWNKQPKVQAKNYFYYSMTIRGTVN